MLPVARGNIGSIVQRNETGVATLDVQGFDEPVKSKPVDLAFTVEKRPYRVQHIAIGAKTALDNAVCVFCFALKPQPCDVFNRILDEHE